MIDVYEELKNSMLESCFITEDQADEVMKFLRGEGVLDYDTLKEMYLDDDE